MELILKCLLTRIKKKKNVFDIWDMDAHPCLGKRVKTACRDDIHNSSGVSQL